MFDVLLLLFCKLIDKMINKYINRLIDKMRTLRELFKMVSLQHNMIGKKTQ